MLNSTVPSRSVGGRTLRSRHAHSASANRTGRDSDPHVPADGRWLRSHARGTPRGCHTPAAPLRAAISPSALGGPLCHTSLFMFLLRSRALSATAVATGRCSLDRGAPRPSVAPRDHISRRRPRLAVSVRDNLGSGDADTTVERTAIDASSSGSERAERKRVVSRREGHGRDVGRVVTVAASGRALTTGSDGRRRQQAARCPQHVASKRPRLPTPSDAAHGRRLSVAEDGVGRFEPGRSTWHLL